MIAAAAVLLALAQTPTMYLVSVDEFYWLVTLDPQLASAVMEVTGESLLRDCAETALTTCGAGKVCYVCVATNTCVFSCQDAEGHCTAAPPCGPSDE